MRPLVLASLVAAAAACAPEAHVAMPDTVTEKRAARAVVMARGDAPDDDELRAAPPPPLRAKKHARPTPREAILPNGVRVVTLERHEFPSVSCAFVLERGAAAVPPAAARIYASALEGSSEKFSRNEAWSYLQFVGATVRTRAYQGGIVLQVTALAPLAVSALSRAAPMFLAPKLDGDDLDRARTRAIAERSEDRDAPGRRAREALLARLFPAPHPYGVPLDGGSEDAIRRVHSKDVAQLRDLYLSPEHVVVACAGDLQHDRLVRVLATHVASLARKPERPAPELSPPRLSPARVVVIDRPGAAQSNVALGWQGPSVSAPDAAAADVLTAAAGAGLSSRLNLKVRKELGATYGVHVSLLPLRASGAITVRAAIETDRTAPALRALVSGLQALRETPLSAAELASAKLRSGFAADAATNDGLAAELAQAVVLGRPAAEALDDSARVDALTAEDLLAAAQRWLTNDGARLVVVGDASKIARDLASLGLGEVDVVRDGS